MPLSGALLADFSSFTKACSDAEVSLRSFETGAGKVEKSLTTVTNSLSGVRIVQQATIAAQAVERIGGVSRLTDAELQRMGALATEAVAKLTVLGEKVPPGIQQIADRARAAADQTNRLADAAKTSTPLLSSMGSELATIFSVGAIVRFGNQILDAGDQIQKMADQTGLGTAEVQKLQYIAGQSGTSIESLVGAVQNLQVRLGDENTGAAGAMAKLGVHADTFNKLGTYEQVTLLADRIRAIQSPTEQASAAAAIFGKSWKEILPAIKAGMVEVGDQAPIMSESTVKALDDIGDAQARAKATAITWGGYTVVAIEQVGFAFGDFLSKFNPEHLGVATSTILALQAQLNDPDGLQAALGAIKKPVLDIGAAFHTIGATSPGDLAKIKLAEMDLTATAEASIIVNKRRIKEEEDAWKIEETSLARASDLWKEHFRTVRDEGLSTVEQQKAAVQDWSDDQIEKIDYTADNWKELYDVIMVRTKDKLNAIDAALARTAQASVECTEEAVTGFQRWNEEIMGVTRALDGAIKSEKELRAEHERGGSTQYDLSTEAGRAQVPEDIATWLHVGYSMAQASRLSYALKMGFDISRDPLFATMGPRVPGFKDGGPTTAGPAILHANEYVVPEGGALVMRGGDGGGGAAVINHNTFNIVDNSENLARKLADLINRGLMRRGLV